MKPRRVLVGGTALVVLLAVVGLASRAHTPAGGGTTNGLDRDIMLEYTLLFLIALSIIVVPIGIWLFVSGRDDDLAANLPERKNWMLAVLVTMSALAVISVVVLSSGWLRRHSSAARNPLDVLSGIAGHGTRVRGSVGFDWGPVVVVSCLALLAAGALGYLAVQQRHKREPALPPIPAAVLAAALEQTIADLRAEPDPRRAVIGAYAQMERALAGVGLERAHSEAPREYLERVLPEVGASADSVTRLTSLFERAKFSPHAIDETMKEAAISALEALRDDLRADE